MSDEEKKPRRRIWEVQPIDVRVDQEIDSAVKTPEDTDINASLKRIKLDRVRRMVDEAEKLEVEEVLEERRTNIEELRVKRKELSDRRKRQDEEEGSTEAAQAQAPHELGAAELSKLVEVSKLPQEQRDEFYRAVAYTRGMYGGSGANADSMIPMMLMFSKQSKEIGFPEMIEFSKNLMSVAKQMREESKADGGKDADINEVIKTIYAEKGKDAYSFKDFIETLKQTEELRRLFAPQQSASSANTSVEMAKIEKGHELELKKLAQQKILEERKIGVEEKKAESLGSGLMRIAATAGAAFATGEAGGGDRVEHRPRRPPAASGVMEFACVKCGATIAVPDPKPGDQATCGKCGWMHTIAEEKGEGGSKKDEQGK